MQRLDIVLFGATGFTGKFVARELAQIFQKENFTLGIAGRSQEKLNELLTSIRNDLGSDTDKIVSIIADIKDQNSIHSMCEKAKIIINCVGPYRFYGEIVIKECIKTETHHIDVSGEPEFLERMQLNYNQSANDANIFVIGSCGFDSIPADIGFQFTKDKFDGDLNHIESFLSINSTGHDPKINFATWESAVHGFGSAGELGIIRKKLFKSRLPQSQFKPLKKVNSFGYFYDTYLKKYAMPFLGSDRSVVQRTQHFNYEVLHERPTQYYAYFLVNSKSTINKFLFWGLIFSILAKFQIGRKLLLKHYSFFSRGLVVKGDMKAEELATISCKMEFNGQGWKTKLQNINEQHNEAPDTSIFTEMIGPEPGYICTAKILSQCALVLLRESDKMPLKGGVLTPGSAFRKTSLIDRLIKNGITFNVVSNL